MSKRADDLAFEAWMHQFDTMCIEEFGVDTDNFPDWHFRDAYDDDLTVAECWDDYYRHIMESF